MSDGFISRWSRRKTEAKQFEAKQFEAKKDVVSADAEVQPPVEAPPTAPQPLPPVESLTPESDFTPFMKPEVDAETKRKAVKMLFQDPRYNVMDGLDVYIDDYSKPDPLPEGWLEKMTQMARLGEYRKPEPEPEAAPETAAEEPRVDASADAIHTSDEVPQPAQMQESKPDP